MPAGAPTIDRPLSAKVIFAMNESGRTHYVDSSAMLDEFLQALDGEKAIAIDTEFMRERTYFPKLCLIQVALSDSVWCIDPLALEDPSLLFGALHDPAREKVIHAARQDLEIFFNETGRIPTPLFDTQIAAALLGRPDQIAYGGLVGEFFSIDLDKTSTRTNWAQRPLTNSQLAYAAADVRYLKEIKCRLVEELRRKGRESWLEEECSGLCDPRRYENEPSIAWRRVKGVAKLDRGQLGTVRALAAWRERTARARDLPRGWVLKDDRLIALARTAPSSSSELLGVDGLAPGLVRRYGEELLATISGADTESFLPDAAQLPRLTDAGKSLVGDMLNALRKCAMDSEVSAALIATRRDVEMAVCGRSGIRFYEGWRKDLFGDFVRQRIAAHSHVLLYE